MDMDNTLYKEIKLRAQGHDLNGKWDIIKAIHDRNVLITMVENLEEAVARLEADNAMLWKEQVSIKAKASQDQ